MLRHIRKAKKNTTDRLHEYCCLRFPSYGAWHEHPYHTHTHWFLFLVFFVGWIMGLSFQLWWFPVSTVRALSWHQSVALDTGTNDESSVAIASNGTIGVAWYDGTNKRLRYAYCTSNCASSISNWTIETVDGDSNTNYNSGEFPSLAFNGNIPGIMFYQRSSTSGSYSNRYAVRDSGNTGCGNQSSTSWTCEIVDGTGITGGNSDKYFSLTYSTTGQARAAWSRFSTLEYGVRVGDGTGNCSGSSQWSCANIDETNTNYATLMLDGSDNPSIVYSKGHASGDIKFASCTTTCTTASNWSTIIVSDDTTNSFDSSNASTDAKLVGGVYYVATFDSTNNDIIYYTCTATCTTDSNWSSAIIVDASADSSTSLSIAINTSNNPRIAYYRSNAVYFAKCDGSCTIASNWSTESVGSAANDRPGLFIDSSGNANISFTTNVDAINYVLSSADTPPTLASLSVTGQATDGTGYVTFSVQASDVNNDTTKAKIEYSDDGGTTWYKAFLVTASTTVSAGTVDTNNGNAYQIGTSDPIETTGGMTITLTVVWDTKSTSNGKGEGVGVTSRNTNVQVRVTANDGTFDGTKATSSNFTVDNAAPTGLASFAKGTPTATTMPLTWSVASDGGFSKYDIWYGTSQNDVQGRSGGATKWSTLNDAALGTVSTTATTITGLSVNTQYYFKIWAIDSAGNEVAAADISGYSGVNAPGAPTVNGATASTLAITIDTNSNPANTTYAIQEDGSTLYVQADGTLGASAVWQTNAVWGTVTVTGLTKNTSYAFGVKARNGDAVSVGYFSTTAAYTAVDAPTNFRVTASSTTALTVAVASFTNDSVAPAGYRFRITAPITADSGWQSGNNTYTFSSLAAHTTYTLSVTYRTTGSVEVGPATLQASTDSLAGSVDTIPPRPVSAFSASAASDGSILLTWIDPPDADFLDIIILRSVGAFPISGDTYARVSRGVRRFTDRNVSAGEKYHYILKAEDTANNFSLSAEQSVALLIANGQGTATTTEPTAPTSLITTPATNQEPPAPRASGTVNIKELIRVQHFENTPGTGDTDGCTSGVLLCTLNRFFRVQNIPDLQLLINTFIPNRQRQEIARTRLSATNTTKKIVGVFGGLYDLVPQGYAAGESFTPPITITIRYNPRDAAILLQSPQSLALAYFNATTTTWEIVVGAVQNIPEGSWTASVGKAGTYGIVIVE